jgi:acetyltransferase-like isoleucine patch superfamily enzyme
MNNKYCFSEILSTVYAFVLTKLFYHGARLIRRPLYLRGKESLIFERGLTTGHACRFDLKGEVKTLIIGENCEMGDNMHIVAYEKVEIGRNVLIASKVFISDTNHGVYKGYNSSTPFEAPNERKLITLPIIIGNNVWVGENAVILAGSVIGNGCIIGANAVVKGKFNDNCIIAGVPAKVIKKWDSNKKEWL